MRHLAEDKFRIEFHVVLLQESEKFRFEVHFLVMGFLVSDVSDDRRNVGSAYAEGCIALLPR